MIAMTFRVSEMESFRQWRDNEDAEVELLLARMRGQTEASEVMLAGTAFHKALELAPTGVCADTIGALGYTFKFAGDFEIALPTIREVRASKTYRTDDYAITISGQLDTLYGTRVEDHKTTGRFDPERYLSGYQWRQYLSIFGADQFRWNVFEIAATDDPLVWEVTDAHRLEQFRYPGMDADCERLAHELATFALDNMPERLRRVDLRLAA
jgi:hypothetical protein